MPPCLSKGSRAGLGIAPTRSQQISRQVHSGKQVCGQAGTSKGCGQAQHTCHAAPARVNEELFSQQSEPRLHSCSAPLLVLSPKALAGGERLRSRLVLRALVPNLPLLQAAESSEYRVQNTYPEDETQSF